MRSSFLWAFANYEADDPDGLRDQWGRLESSCDLGRPFL